MSLHHYKSWYNLAIEKMHAVADVCGECFLQRWKFQDTVLSNGYSIAKYIADISDEDLERMEGTWGHPNAEFDFSMGPLRERLGEAEKETARFVDAKIRQGQLIQTYIRRTDGKDEVFELVWK